MRCKVLFFIPTLENGGAEKVLVNLVNNMDYDRYEVTVQTLFDYGVHKDRLNDRVHYRSFLKKPFRGYTDIISVLPAKFLYKRIIREKYDIIVSYLEGSSAKIISGCTYEETKRIAWIHTVMDNPRRFRIGFHSIRQAVKVYRRFDRLVFVSASARDAFRKNCSFELLNDLVVYNTNESEKILALSKDAIDDVQINQDEFNICCVGKITPNKGFDRLAHILKELRAHEVNAHIYAIGTGEQTNEIVEYLQKNHLQDYYSFLGYKENPYKYVAACELYVCASHREGFSTAVTEALIVGTPVVSTDCSGAYELLGNANEYGIVTNNNEESLLRGIEVMAKDKDLYQRFKARAIERGKEFTTKKTVRIVEDLFEEVLHE